MSSGTAGRNAPPEGDRRFLLTGVVSRYHHDPSWNREELSADLSRMIGLFTGALGYEHVPVMGLDPTWLQIQDALRDFCTSPDRRPDDYITVYLAGHGEVLPVGDTGAEHVLLPADAIPGDPRRRAIKSADLAEWMLADTPVRRLLLIVDTCYSGQGGMDFARNALARIGSPVQLSQGEGCGVVVVTATQPAQQAIAGAFTMAFTRAVRSQATSGHAPGALSIDAVMNVLKTDPGLPLSQQAQWSMLAGSGAVPDFLLNPRRDTSLVDVDLAEQDRRWHARLGLEHQRAEEMRSQFIPRITGFTGRHRALADIASWLNAPADARPLIVTGDPGSGKTAVLALLAAFADPRRRPTIPRHGLPEAAIPREDAIGTAIYAGNLTSGQILAGLAAAADIDNINPDPTALSGEIGQLLSRLRNSDKTLVAMIDALDEAADPPHLAEQLLRPLIERGKGTIRLLLGTRRHLCGHLGRNWQARSGVIDLDSLAYADPAALAAVIRRILTGGAPPRDSPFASCPPAILDAVTAVIAEAAGHSFFVARILADTQAAQLAMPSPTDPAWRASLPKAAGPAMRQDLELRLGDRAAQAIDLLRPLAYAQGRGLPWEDIWPLLANALSPSHSYTNEDLLWLADHAGSFIVEGGTISDRSVYRLYHRSLAEDLITGRDRAADEHAITIALTRHVPRDFNGRPDWPASHPYIRTHLAVHAAQGDTIDDLSQDPGFLLAASPPELLTALDSTVSKPARAAAGAYRSARLQIRRHPSSEHASYLGLAARCGRAEALADRIDADGLTGPWRAHWASWQLQRPHQQLTGHNAGVTAVAAAELAGRPVVITGSNDRTARVWDLATGTPIGDPLTGHDGAVRSVAAAELEGRPVVITGSNDRTVRVWDLATGTPSGMPFTGHSDWVTAVATAELAGRPVIITGSNDRTVRVWDLATGTPSGMPFTGHSDWVTAVATAELAGRPVIITGSNDCTVRVWDLATGTPSGKPFTGHSSAVTAVATAELAGRPVIITGSSDATVRVWDLATGTPVGDPFTGHSSAVRSVATAELAGRPVIVTGSSDATVRVWDLATGTPVGDSFTGTPAGDSFTGHGSAVRSVAVAELERRPVVISGSGDGTVRVWDLATGTPADDPFTGHGGAVYAVAAAELAGRPVLITGSNDSTVRVWDLATGTPVGKPFTGHKTSVTAVAMAELAGRPVLITGSNDSTVRVWDLATGTPVGKPFTGHGGAVRSVAAAGLEGRPVVISGRVDGTVRVWDLATGTPVGRPFTGHSGAVRSVAAAELEGRPVIVSGSVDGTVRVWDLATGTPVGKPFTGHSDVVTAVATAELTGRPVIVSGSVDGTVRVWDLATGTPVGEPFTGHSDVVTAVATAELTGRPVIVSGSGDSTVRVWDLATGTPVGKPFTGHGDWVTAVATVELADRPVIITGSGDRTARVWDLAAGTPVGDPFTGHNGAVTAVAAAELEDRPVIITGSGDATVRVWEAATGISIVRPFTGHSGAVTAVAAAELEGRPVVITGSGDATVRVWDLATGTPVGMPFTGHSDWVTAVAAAELEGRPVIVSGSNDRTARVWDLATGTPVGKPFTGHSDWVTAVAAAELEGRPVIVTGSNDRTARVWDLATRKPIGEPFAGHSGAVTAVATVELEGRPVVITGSNDRTARVWDLATRKPISEPSVSRETVQSVASRMTHSPVASKASAYLCVGTGNVAQVSLISAIGDNDLLWQNVATLEVGSHVLALRWVSSNILAVGAELGIVVIDLSAASSTGRNAR